jgi:hypothetical protein
MFVTATKNVKRKINDSTWESAVHKLTASFKRMTAMK